MSLNFSDDGFAIVEPSTMFCSPANEGSEDTATSGKIFRSHGIDFVRQPCKARGIEIARGQNPHVARFAYIDIPIGTKHGTVLSCVHPVCIDSGRRFRYCIHCKTAVAKRNFNVRHAHGSLNSPPSKVVLPQVVPVSSSETIDVVETAVISVPAVIPFGNHQTSSTTNTTSVGDDTVSVILSSQEVLIINHLRCRPGDEHPSTVDQWKETLLKMTENLSNQRSLASPAGAVSKKNQSIPGSTPVVPESKPAQTTTTGDASVASFDAEDFENFDFFEVPDLFEQE